MKLASESYGAISFSGITRAGPFYEQILSGRKRQTLREPRKDGRDHVKVGKLVKLYWKMRRKPEQKPGEPHFLGFAKVIAYDTVYLHEMWDDEENAIADGFASLEEFRDWFFEPWRWFWTDHDKLIAHFKEFDYIFQYRLIKWEWPLVG